jgi:hypothetical protein
MTQISTHHSHSPSHHADVQNLHAVQHTEFLISALRTCVVSAFLRRGKNEPDINIDKNAVCNALRHSHSPVHKRECNKAF